MHLKGSVDSLAGSRVSSSSQQQSTYFIQRHRENKVLSKASQSDLTRYVYNYKSREITPASPAYLRKRFSYRTTTPSAPVKASKPRSGADVSIPGMGKLFDDSYCIQGKIAWGIAIAICFIVCVGLIGDRIAEFIKIPVEIGVDVATNSTLNYPAVTVCPFYPLQYSAQVHALKIEYARFFNVSYQTDNETDLASKVHSMDLLRLPHINVSYLWGISRIGNILAEPLCEFRTQKHCERFVSRTDLVTYHGICETLSYDGEIRYDGYYNGFKIIPFNYKNIGSVYWRFMIILHEQNDLPKHRIYLESGHVIHPLYETTITFQIKQYRRVNTPSQPCRGRRQVQSCNWKCIEKFVVDKVNCSLPYLDTSGLRPCSTTKEAMHTLKITRNAYKNLQTKKLCAHCPRKCVEDFYSLMPDVVKPRNVTYIKVLLQDNTVEVVKESPSYSVNVLLSEVGGNLGLFLGVCILTALQILEIILVEIKNKLFSSK